MLCENCGNFDANVKYTQIINGVKKQMNLCENCANELGLNNMSFSMPMDMFNLFENVFSDNIFEPQMVVPHMLIDDVLERKIQTNRRKNTEELEQYIEKRDDGLDTLIHKINKERKNNTTENKKIMLQKRLEKEIQEERYEDAAKTRDEIKKLEK